MSGYTLSTEVGTDLRYRQDPIFTGSGESFIPKLAARARSNRSVLEPLIAELPKIWAFEDRLLAWLVPSFVPDIARYYRFQHSDLGHYFRAADLSQLDGELLALLEWRLRAPEPTDGLTVDDRVRLVGPIHGSLEMLSTLASQGVLTAAVTEQVPPDAPDAVISCNAHTVQVRLQVPPAGRFQTLLNRLRLLRVLEFAAEQQKGFLLGTARFLKPLTIHQAAQFLDLVDSTPSRLVKGIRLATPRGTFAIEQVLRHREGDNAVELLQDIIRREDPDRPMTDEELGKALSQEGIHCSRRTVAKYRALGHIPSAAARRRAARRAAKTNMSTSP